MNGKIITALEVLAGIKATALAIVAGVRLVRLIRIAIARRRAREN